MIQALITIGLKAVADQLEEEVRQLSRFIEFIRKIGPVDYWNKFGWLDISYTGKW